MMKYVMYILLAVGALAVVAELLHASPLLIFVAAGLGLIPLAGILGDGTEALAKYTGPRLGGLLNATLGNAVELIITTLALWQGAVNPAVRESSLLLVKASITGSIMGNVLLILGASIFLGGLKYGIQRFDRSQSGINMSMLLLAVIAISIPSIFSQAIDEVNHPGVEYLTLGIAAVMLLVYALGIVFTQRLGHVTEVSHDSGHAPSWSKRQAIMILIAATAAIALLSEILVGAVEPVVTQFGISEFFLGIILIPIVGNVAEHLVAVQAAMRDDMELSLAISWGSSLQIALFVTPLLVFISLAFGNPMTLTFTTFEIVTLAAVSLIAAFISQDGESNWLEGVMLLSIYLIVAIAAFFVPF